MSAFDTQDFLVLHLALDMLSKYTENELAQARKNGRSTKTMAMMMMRTHIASVRAKVFAMEVPS